MARNDLIITNTSWALLSPAEQAAWDNHYIDFAAQAAALTGTITDLYTLLYEDIIQSSQATYSFTASGTCVIDGGGKLLNDNQKNSLIILQISGSCIFKNFRGKCLDIKGVLTESFFKPDLSGATVTFENSIIDLNNKNGVGIYNWGGNVENKNIAVIDGTRGFSQNIATNTMTCKNCVSVGHTNAYVRISGGGTLVLQNCYGSSSGTVLSGIITANNTVTSDASAPVTTNRNKAPADMFVDLVDFIPVEGTVMETAAVDSGVTPSLNGYPRPPYYVGTNNPVPDGPTLTSPADSETEVSTSPTFTWSEITGKTSYQLQVSKFANFSTTIIDDNTLTTESYATSGLDNSQLYYWRVRTSYSGALSNWSTIFSFTTESNEAIVKITKNKAPKDIEGKGDITIGTSEVEITFSGIPEHIRIQADITNTGTILLGKTGVLSDGSNSFEQLEPGDEIIFKYNDIANAIFAISNVAGQTINAGATIKL